MSAWLGLLAALSYGVSDFLGGVASRRAHFLWVGLGVQLIGAVLSFALAPMIGTALSPASLAPSLGWGALSGVGSAVGLVLLYRGYGRGSMAVVGPLSAVGAAVLPSVAGVLLGDRLSLLALVGVVVALPAIWLVSRQSDGAGRDGAGQSRGQSRGQSHGQSRGRSRGRSRAGRRVRTGVLDGIVSGLGFGVLFTALGQADPRSGLWPVATGQLSSTVLVAVIVAVGAFGRPSRPGLDRRALVQVLGTAVLSIGANVAFLAATRHGSITVSAVLTALYPAFTVLLAVAVLRERPERGQLVGLALAAAAVTLIVLG